MQFVNQKEAIKRRLAALIRGWLMVAGTTLLGTRTRWREHATSGNSYRGGAPAASVFVQLRRDKSQCYFERRTHLSGMSGFVRIAGMLRLMRG